MTSIVMEFADDGDLLQKINERKKDNNYFEETFVWSVLIQTVRGLRSMHDLKILHRDMKVCYYLECECIPLQRWKSETR